MPLEPSTEEGGRPRRFQRPHQLNLTCQRQRKKIHKVQVEGARDNQGRWERRNVLSHNPTLQRVVVNTKVLRQSVGNTAPGMPHQVFNVL